MTASSPEFLFDSALIRRAPQLAVAPESPAHRAFLSGLFAACSPLVDVLPSAMMEMQFAAQDASFRHDHPLAMRRITTWQGAPVGRIIVDWDMDDGTLGVDIAVNPAARASGAGLAMLRAWVEVADALGLPAKLNVLSSNPVQRIYQHLGFRPVAGSETDAAYITMTRPVV
jgi:GNAT superfamily N-acetyltransferase